MGLYPRIFTIVTVALLGYLLFLILQPFLTVLAWSALLAFLLHPAHQRLTRWLRDRRALSSTLLTLATLVISIGPLTALGVAFARQAASLLENLQSSYGELKFTGLSSLGECPAGRQCAQLGARGDALHARADEQRRADGRENGDRAPRLPGRHTVHRRHGDRRRIPADAVPAVLLPARRRSDDAPASNLIPMPKARKHDLLQYLGTVTRAVVFGTLLTALLQGTLVGHRLRDHRPAVPGGLWRDCAAVLSLLPIGGTALIWGPAAIILVVQGRYGAALFMLLWGVAARRPDRQLSQAADHLGRAEVPTLAAFLGVLGGLAAFGPIGMFLGPVILALTIALVRWAEENRAGSCLTGCDGSL